MNLLDNLVIMNPPRLRRSTHNFCGFCFNNMGEYGEETCDRCLLSVREKGMVVTGIHHKNTMGRMKYFCLTLKSMFLRFMRWCGW